MIRVNDKKVIVSLASWKPRYPYLAPVLDSLLSQAFKVDKIILCLDEEDEDTIPTFLMDYSKRGVDICFYKNIRSYKKLIPALKRYPNDIIITVDDDIMYPRDLVSNLYKSYCNNPNTIHANRCRVMKRSSEGEWLPYSKAKVVKTPFEKIGHDLLFTGVGGVLYPGIEVLHDDVLNEDLFLRLAPRQDDLWFWYMARLRKTKICKPKKAFIPRKRHSVDGTQEFGLYVTNLRKDGPSENDKALSALNRYYNT